MTHTAEPASAGQTSPPAPNRRRRRWLSVAAAFVAMAGAGTGAGLAFSGRSKPTAPAGVSASAYGYYQQVMGRFGSGGMMGGGSTMGGYSYAWMMGGADAPDWMSGSSLPSAMMGGSTDPGEVMGSLFADASGPRIAAAAAAGLTVQIPAGARIDRKSNTVTFSGSSVHLAVVASPARADDRFEVAGLVDPTVVVRAGARVSVELFNADATSAHGLVITDRGASSWMPMITARAAFAGSAIWFLGDPTSAGLHAATMTFTAASAGTYRYLCPVPGHARKGMAGALIVESSPG